MKKIALLLALMLVTMASHAQKIDCNERDENGWRTISVPLYPFYIDNQMYGLNFEYKEKEGKESYLLSLMISNQSYRWSIPLGREMLFKAQDGEVLKYNFYGKTDFKFVGKKYHVIAAMMISKEDGNIIDKGLVKMRIPRKPAYSESITNLDIDFPADVTEYLQNAKKLIDETIATPVTVDKSEF